MSMSISSDAVRDRRHLVGQEAYRQRLDESERESADHSARNASDSAEDRRRERLDSEHGTCIRVDVLILRRVKHRRDSSERRAYNEGQRDRAVDVYAHQLSRALVLRHSEHRAPYARLLYEEIKRNHYDDCRTPDNERDDRDLERPDAHLSEVEEALEKLSVRLEDEERDVLKEIRHADCRDKNRQAARLSERLVRQLLDDEPERRADNDAHDHRDRSRKTRHVETDEYRIDAHHNDVAMREVEHLRDAVNHRVAERHEGVDASEVQSVYYRCEKNLHYVDQPFR